jgi:uncharacterized protein (TIGR00255 family)
MIRSMTAFARVEAQEPWGTLTWELRTVNHRFLEMYMRLPDELRALEGSARELVPGYLGRGKLDATLRFQAAEQSSTDISVNVPMARALAQAARDVESVLAHPAPLAALDMLRWPGVLDMPELDLEPVRQRALALIRVGLAELVDAREREGTKLRELVRQRCDGLDEQIVRARERMPEVLVRIRQRLLDRLAELESDLDPQRLEQEIAILAQKLDVDEEMDRLRSHVGEVRRILDGKRPAGRRLDFLTQELNREANTLGSKSADVETTRASVEMKVLIEQIREQVQNIE